MAKPISKASQSQGMLMFKLSLTQSFAIGTLKVREIVPFQPMTQIPYSHHHVIGTVTIRDLTVPVIDMSAAIGFRPITPAEYQDCVLIVTDCLRTVVAFLVRSIDKIIECDWKSIESPPTSVGRNVFVTGITRFEDRIVQMLDVELLLSKIYPAYENAHIPMLTDVERERLKALNILLVDDSLIARKQLSDALDSINIPYSICNNGFEAFPFYIGQHWDMRILISWVDLRKQQFHVEHLHNTVFKTCNTRNKHIATHTGRWRFNTLPVAFNDFIN